MSSVIDIFKALGDENRLRMLRAVLQAELAVAEITELLGLPQSTVSRHLKPLREKELVQTRREGTTVFYQPGKALSEPALRELLEGQFEALAGRTDDALAIEAILDRRRDHSRAFFDKVAGRYAELARPGGGWMALAGALAAGFRDCRVADIGCGEGELSFLLAPFVKEVVAMDQSDSMLRLIREKAEVQNITSITPIRGEQEQLPIETRSCDAAFLSQVLHHAAHPAAAVREAARILRDGGQLILLDLVRHEQEWMREEWADVWLGFEPEKIVGWLRDAGLKDIQIYQRQGDTAEIPVIQAVGLK